MTDKFEVRICPIPYYVKYKSSDYTLANIQFDIIQDGVPFDNGHNGWYKCCDIGLKKLIKAADDFLAGRITEKTRLRFVIPDIYGEDSYYGYFFEINVGSMSAENYWEFKATPNHIVREWITDYACRLNQEQVAALRNSVARQFEAFDWENCGKTEFFRFDVPDRPYEWCYSAKRLETMLNELLTGQKLQAIYVSGTNYAGPLSVRKNYVDYYLGSRVYLAFEKTHADILAHAYGLFEIRFFDADQVNRTRFYDELENGDEVLCDTGDVFQLHYEGETIKRITVDADNYWAYTAKGFDISKVGDPVELPSNLHFVFHSGSQLTIIGGEDDFVLKMELPASK